MHVKTHCTPTTTHPTTNKHKAYLCKWWQNGTRCRDGVKVLWCHSHLVWLILMLPSLHALVFLQKTFVTCMCICGCPVQKSKIFLSYITIASPHSYPRPVLATRNVLYPTLSFFLYLSDPRGAPSTSVLAIPLGYYE